MAAKASEENDTREPKLVVLGLPCPRTIVYDPKRTLPADPYPSDLTGQGAALITETLCRWHKPTNLAIAITCHAEAKKFAQVRFDFSLRPCRPVSVRRPAVPCPVLPSLMLSQKSQLVSQTLHLDADRPDLDRVLPIFYARRSSQ